MVLDKRFSGFAAVLFTTSKEKAKKCRVVQYHSLVRTLLAPKSSIDSAECTVHTHGEWHCKITIIVGTNVYYSSVPATALEPK